MQFTADLPVDTGQLAWLHGKPGFTAGFGGQPLQFITIDADGKSAAFVLAGFMLLAGDHRASDAMASILLLTFAAIAGWITFYAPEGTIEHVLPFMPASVNDALGRLLFGLGAVTSVGMAVWALRRLFR